VDCPVCHTALEVSEYTCPACALTLRGRFLLPRLARLDAEQQQLAEQLILAGGNLTELAREQGISHPTLRKRLDSLIAALQALRAEDERRTGELLTAVEQGTMAPEFAARLIREQNGGA